LHDRRAERPADADLVMRRFSRRGGSLVGRHAIRVGVRGMSAHRTV
jgi:hypothetical protein